MKLEAEGGKGWREEEGTHGRAFSITRRAFINVSTYGIMCSLNIISRASNRRERVSPGGHGEAYRGSSARSAVFESARLTLKPPPEIATISTIVEARVRASARRGRETGGGFCLVSALSKAILAGERDTTAARLLRPRLYFSPPIRRALLRDPIFRHTFQSRFDRPLRHMRVHLRGSVGRSGCETPSERSPPDYDRAVTFLLSLLRERSRK